MKTLRFSFTPRASSCDAKREGRACRVRLRNVEHRGHSIQRHAPRAARVLRAPMPFDGARSRQARPARATIAEETTGGTHLSRPPTERRTQGAFHSAPRAEGGAGTSRADAVRWGTVATSATRLGKPHAARLGQKTKPDANTHLAERDWRREGDLNPRYGD